MKKEALYVRASTIRQDETIEAQTKILKEYCATNGLEYILYVEKESGQKTTRPEYQRLLDDVAAGKINKIYFTKLDRWFRNLGEYALTNEFLKKHNVSWSAVLEPQYNTDTAMGAAITNIIMALAEMEAKQVGERIDVVFENKVAKGEVLHGPQSLPYGYTTKDKKVVKDPELEHIVYEIFDHFEHVSNSVRATKLHVEAMFNLSFHYNTIRRMMSNTLYYGEYRGNKTYVQDPYLTYERWINIQRLLNINARKRATNRTYIFSGLIVCDECECIHVGKATKKKNDNEYLYYRCNQAYMHNRCGNRTSLSELKVEAYLLENIGRLLDEEIERVDASITDDQRQEMIDNEKSIRRKQARLKELYLDDFFTLEEFRQKHAELEAQIIKPPRDGQKDLQEIKNLIEGDWFTVYKTLSREEKRTLWRGIIEGIVIRRGQIVGVNFL